MWRILDSLKNRSLVLLQLNAWLSAFCKEIMSVGFDIILKHLVSSANRDNKASVTCNGRSLIKTANRSGPSMLR